MKINLALGLCLLAAIAVNAQSGPLFLNGIAAIVDDTIITVKEVKDYIEPALRIVERTYFDRPQELDKKRQEILEDGINQLVERQLILSDFKKSGRELPESIIDEEINREIREQYGDRVTLIKELQAMGITFEKYRQRTRERILVSALRSMKVSEEIIISPHKIETYYAANKDKFQVNERVKLRIIQIKSDPSDPGRALRIAREILAKINSGTPFNEMTVYHEGSQKNGDWGWVEFSVLRKELADAARKLKPGQHSDIIETSDACWLLMVEDYQPAHIRPLAEVRDEIEKELIAQERNRLQKKWVDRLKAKSFVRYF